MKETDGRILRSERSRQQLIDTIVEIIRKGGVQPTGEQVAAAAGVSLRTVFRHFGDLEGLDKAVRERVVEEVRPLFREGAPFEGDLRSRVKDLVGRRVQAFERVAPFRRMVARTRRGAPPLGGPSELDRGLRIQVAAALGPELAERGDLIEVIDALLSFEAWNRMRTTQGLGRARTAQLLEAAVLKLLDGSGAI